MLKLTFNPSDSRPQLAQPLQIPAAIEAEIKRTGCSIAVATKRVVDLMNRSRRVR